MAEIRVHRLRKAFADFTAVQDSTFTVRDGEFFCLLGPSGCGKTTTLRMIAGLELPTSGQIFLGDEDVTFKRASARDIAFVFQMFALYPHLNVRRNIAFPLVSQGMARAQIAARVEQAARVLRIGGLLDQPVSRLSSGDRQRVALGRAIVREPLAFLMDEPLGALDSEFREEMCLELRALHDRLGATTVYVTHDQLEAMAMADTIAVMNHGVVEQLGAPLDVYQRPASVFVADFIGSPAMNFLPFEAALAAGDRVVRVGSAPIDVPALREDVPERGLLCGVRPEHVHFSERSALRAQVLGTEYLGTSRIVTLATADGAQMRAKVDVASRAARGDHVGLVFDAEAVSLFDRATGRALRTARDDAGRIEERTMADLSLVGVSKRFGTVQAVDSLTLAMASGEFVVLLGPSGAGKTTTLRLVAGLEQADRGSVHIGGRGMTHVAPALRDVAFVFQQYSLYPHLSVFDNLAFPLRSPLRPARPTDVRRKVEEVARLLRIEDKLQSPATRLSGGQMQRVAIGRALVRDPALYLMDEPLSSLDAKLRNDLRLELKRIQQDLGATMLYVTHDQMEALTMATRIGVLEQGRLVQVGSPQQVYEDPASTYVAARLGSPRINLIARALVPGVGAPGQAATVGVRAEHLRLHGASAASARPAARVRRIERLGDRQLVHVQLAGTEQELVTAAPGGDAFDPGTVVQLELLRPLWFDAAGHRIAV